MSRCRVLFVLSAVLLLASVSFSHAQSSAAARLVLENGTPVKVRLTRNVSSVDAKVGEQVEFEVLEEVRVSDIVVIPKGSSAYGTVTEAEPKKTLGKSGKLQITMDSVRLASGQKTALRSPQIVNPVSSGLLGISPKDVTVAKGTEITAYINGNCEIERAKFAPTKPATGMASGDAKPPEDASATSSVLVSSTPVGAEIELDDAFVGSTPSIISMSVGDHKIVLKKRGFKPWERKVKATMGSIKIDVELEPM